MDDRPPMDRKVEVLRDVPLFSDLDTRSLEAISVLAREVELPADQILMLEGEPGDALYVIVDGTVRIERGDRTVRSMTAGGFLGEIALLDHRPRTATATCVTDCRLLVLQQHEFDRLVETFPSVHRRVRATIARRAGAAGADLSA
jgi:CRP/FNR family cyclic AMP-dependent transcriptional regulator